MNNGALVPEFFILVEVVLVLLHKKSRLQKQTGFNLKFIEGLT